jgi:hypothetical protein
MIRFDGARVILARELVGHVQVRGELAKAVEAGGPALLDHLEALLTSAPAAGSALIVELR